MFFSQTFIPSPVIFNLGPITIHWYGLLLALGILAGFLVAYKLWLKSERQPKNFEWLCFGLVVFGFIGARLLDVFLFEWELFKDNLVLILQIWQGGLAIHGALLAGLVVLWWYAKKHQDSLWQLLDIFAPSLALGQAIGRWGNYFNQELFGFPTNLPWGIFIQPEFRPVEYILAEQFHPVFLYEFLALLVIFIILWQMIKKPYLSGTVFLLYLLLASLVRFVLEFIRVDEQLLIWGMRAGLLISILLIIIASFYLIKRKLAKINPPI